MTAAQKWLPPVWFYDDRGSLLFDEITRLPEYYLDPGRASAPRGPLPEIAATAEADTLVELGAGTCDKSRVLLDAMEATGGLRRYVPLDVSDGTLWAAATALADEYPGLSVHAVVGDFHLPHRPGAERRAAARGLPREHHRQPDARPAPALPLRPRLHDGPRGPLLLGTDLVKDQARLLAAYDDAQGVTAAFNRNVLHVLNRELHASFDPERFEHVALWNEDEKRIEMRLRVAVGPGRLHRGSVASRSPSPPARTS